MGVVIGETAEVGDDCLLYKGVVLGGTSLARGKRHPTLRRGVTVGSNACILGPIEIGEGARVGAGSVVVKPVPAEATVVGVPGRIVRAVEPHLEPDLEHGRLPDPLMGDLRTVLRVERALERAAAPGRGAARSPARGGGGGDRPARLAAGGVRRGGRHLVPLQATGKGGAMRVANDVTELVGRDPAGEAESGDRGLRRRGRRQARDVQSRLECEGPHRRGDDRRRRARGPDRPADRVRRADQRQHRHRASPSSARHAATGSS